MSITLDLPEELTTDLLHRAKLAGQTPAAIVAAALRREFAAVQPCERPQPADTERATGQQSHRFGDDEDRCADGMPWPQTPAGIEAWCAQVESLPPLFDNEAELRAFEKSLAAVRRERAEGMAAHRDRVAGLFTA